MCIPDCNAIALCVLKVYEICHIHVHDIYIRCIGIHILLDEMQGIMGDEP